MKISVIIPVLNESAALRKTLEHLQSLKGNFEVIVVDGGSGDESFNIADEFSNLNPSFTAAKSPKGRALQMNYGSELAKGEVLLFLHADTLLPENFYELISNTLQDERYSGGCFRLSFDNPSRSLKLIAFFSRFSFRFFHYGDQAYFVRKEIFNQLSGYKDYPIMEDVDFWLKMRKLGKQKLLNEPVITSSRRFMQNGVIRQQLLNTALVMMFALGAKPVKLKKFYDDSRKNILIDEVNNHIFRKKTFAEKASYPFRVVWNWAYSNVHNTYGSSRVVGFMAVQKMGAGLIPPDHPWATGISPETGKRIWHENVLFTTPRKKLWQSGEPESDEEIINKTCSFLTSMVERSVHAEPEIPQGSMRRMPHAVNYIHGGINYNGGYMIFNDFKDAMYYFSDKDFTNEFRRFARIERREITVIFRERKYDPTEFAWFVAFIRSVLPWYVNGNGPTKKRVLWGTPAPYANVNPISGSWIFDMVKLYKKRYNELVREPIEKDKYFRGVYRGTQPYYSAQVRFHAWAIGKIIWIRGFQGGMFFTRRKKIEPKNLEKYKETKGEWRAGYPVPGPFHNLEK
jgi:rSAM/selenodomain-associated transferase 2